MVDALIARHVSIETHCSVDPFLVDLIMVDVLTVVHVSVRL